jgi:hypothetical protein
MQNVADGHDTLVSAAFGGPLGAGVGCNAHVAAEAVDVVPTTTTISPAIAAHSPASLRIPLPIPIAIP